MIKWSLCSLLPSNNHLFGVMTMAWRRRRWKETSSSDRSSKLWDTQLHIVHHGYYWIDTCVHGQQPSTKACTVLNKTIQFDYRCVWLSLCRFFSIGGCVLNGCTAFTVLIRMCTLLVCVQTRTKIESILLAYTCFCEQFHNVLTRCVCVVHVQLYM